MQTITINNTLYADAQAYAEERGMSVATLIERYFKRLLKPRTKAMSPEKAETLQSIDRALKEFKLIQEGKLEARSAEELINEL